MKIEKNCRANQDGQCVQCRREVKKRGQRCGVYIGMSKRWPEMIAFLQEELDRLHVERERLLKENDRLQQELDKRGTREAAVALVRAEFQKFSTVVH